MGFLRSFGYAIEGIVHVLKTQRNMKVHLTATLVVATVGLFLRLSLYEWLAVSFTIFFVLAAECINTAIEAIIDLVSPKAHPLAKIAKDCAAGAVLLAAINSVVVALLVFGPKIGKLLAL